MGRKILLLLAVMILIINIDLQQSFAEPLIIPAKDQIDWADLIVIAKVTDFSYSEKQWQKTLEIEEVLKGKESRNKIVVFGEYSFYFPRRINFNKRTISSNQLGKRYILLLIKNGKEYKFHGDGGNYLGINSEGQMMPEEKIKQEKEKLELQKHNLTDIERGRLNAININLDYINTYQDFYNKNHDLKNVRVHEKAKSTIYNWYIFLIPLTLVVLCIWEPRRKRGDGS